MVDELVAQLRVHRTISRFLENLKKSGSKRLNPATLRSRIQTFKEHWCQYQAGHDRLVKTVSADEHSSIDYFKDGCYEKAGIYHDILDYMMERLEEMEPVVSLNQSFAQSVRSEAPLLPLQSFPTIDLPPFDGNYAAWEQFHDRFTSLLRDNKDLSNYVRIHYLVSCLKGRALESISDLAVPADNFTVAWQTLINRFENKRRLIQFHLSTLLSLPSNSRETATNLLILVDRVIMQYPH